MDLIKLIDQNVECVATPNGKYLKRSEVFDAVEKFTSTNIQSTAIAQIADGMENLINEFPNEQFIHTDWVKGWIRQLRAL